MTCETQDLPRSAVIAPRILLFGYVNTNVIDGSAYFMSGAASVLTASGACRVTLVTAVPLMRHQVLAEALVNPGVDVIDPYRDVSVSRDAAWGKARRMSHEEAATLLVKYWERGEHDLILVRGTEVADLLVAICPEVASHLLVYVTGVTFANRSVDPKIGGALVRLTAAGATLLAQTPEMRQRILDHLGDTGLNSRNNVEIMSPAVPGEEAAPLPDVSGLRLVYAGKFAPAWRTVEILAGVLEARERYGDVSICVAGDYFKGDPSVPGFEAEARWLLGRNGVKWIGGVSRIRARDEASKAHVGIGWRSPELDSSLELSTKVLELGTLGRPTILNPTEMHRTLFGEDYPLFANSMDEFVSLLGSLRRAPAVLDEARATMMKVAGGYSYEQVLARLLPVILRVARVPSRDQAKYAFMSRAAKRLSEVSDGSYEEGPFSLARMEDDELLAKLVSKDDSSKPLPLIEGVGPYVFSDSSNVSRDTNVSHTLFGVLEHRSRVQRDGRHQANAAEVLDAEIGIGFGVNGRAELVAVRHPIESETVVGVGMSPTQLRARVKELEQKHKTLSHEHRVLKAAHERLRNARLVRLQLRYWRAVNRLRRRVK